MDKKSFFGGREVSSLSGRWCSRCHLSKLSMVLRPLVRQFDGRIRSLFYLLGRIARGGPSLSTPPRGLPPSVPKHPQLRVAFAPYNSPACYALHGLVSRAVSGKGAKTSLVDVWQLNHLGRINWSPPDRQLVSVRSVETLSDVILQIGQGDSFLARGILDEVSLKLSPENLLSRRLPRDLRNHVDRILEEARRLLDGIDVLVLPDTAYLRNRALASVIFRQGGKVWVVSPSGQSKQILPDSVEDEYFDQKLFSNNNEKSLGVDDYFYSRMGRVKSREADVRKANEAQGLAEAEIHRSPRKVLLLHSFRDANLFPLGAKEWTALFPTFLDWADFCLGVISKSPEDWLIRRHPFSYLYPGDDEILHQLIEKHNLREVSFCDGIPISELISRGHSFFTVQGTIALETAAAGFKSVTCSNLFPEEFVTRAKSIDHLKDLLNSPLADLNEKLEVASVQNARQCLKDFRMGFEPIVVLERANTSSAIARVARLYFAGIVMLAKHASTRTRRAISVISEGIITGAEGR